MKTGDETAPRTRQRDRQDDGLSHLTFTRMMHVSQLHNCLDAQVSQPPPWPSRPNKLWKANKPYATLVPPHSPYGGNCPAGMRGLKSKELSHPVTLMSMVTVEKSEKEKLLLLRSCQRKVSTQPHKGALSKQKQARVVRGHMPGNHASFSLHPASQPAKNKGRLTSIPV